jgi:hypothetical protein
MGRDQTRMLICAVASLVLILAGALFMDWYRATTEGLELNRLSIDLVAVHLCGNAHVCARESLTSVRGMFPSLAAVTLWSSLGFAALVGFQAGARLLAGGAIDVFTKLGYMLALMAISLAVATAYLFGPEVSDVRMVAATWFDVALHRSWAPATLIAGLSVGFVAIYLAVARESSDPAAAYKPVTLDPDAADGRGRRVSIPFPVPPGEQTDFLLAGPPREPTAVTRNDHPSQPSAARREPTGTLRAAHAPAQPAAAPRPPTVEPGAVEPREHTGILHAAHPQMRPPAAPSTMRAARPAVQPLLAVRREQTSTLRAHPQTQPIGSALHRSADAMRAAGPPIQPNGTPPHGQTGTLRVAGAREQTGTQRLAHAPTQPALQPPGLFREQTGTTRAPGFREQTGTTRAPGFREQTGTTRASGFREQTGTTRAAGFREQTGTTRAPGFREQTGTTRAPGFREQTGTMRAATDPGPGSSRTKSGPLTPIPEHLRNRLRYVALTAEVTGGGIDARREDGLSRLVLWRDVVGVVARRMPAVYDSAAFVDIVSTAGSTLRIVPWTRLTGQLTDVDGDARPRAVVEHVVAHCPSVRLDPATRIFLDTGEPAQLPDLDTLRAHDERLA